MSLLQWLGVKTPPDPMEFINFCHVWVANNLQFLSINNFNAFFYPFLILASWTSENTLLNYFPKLSPILKIVGAR